MNNKLTIIYIEIHDIKQYENNPRKNDEAVDFVAKSIEQFGFKVPIVLDRNKNIVAGETRYRAAKKLNMVQVPCIIADDLTKEQIKAFRLADNKVGEVAEWDFNRLEEELAAIDFDMSDFGFEMPEVNIDEFFEETEQKKKESKQIICPHCGLPITG